MKNEMVTYGSHVALEEQGGGVSRKILSYNDQMMIVEVHFEEGGIGAAHTHPHLQSTYVKSGAFRFTVEGKDVEVKEGDTLQFAANMVHGTVCLEKGVLIDIFHPMREDFIK